MNKTIRKNTIYALLTLLLSACVFFLYFAGAFNTVPAVTTKADGTVSLKNGIKDENFSWTNGASLNIADFANGKYTLGFQINLEDPKNQDLLAYESTKTTANVWRTVNKCSVYHYVFTIMKDNGESAEPTPLARLYYRYEYIHDDGEVYLLQIVLRENVTVYKEAITLQDKYNEYLKTDLDTRFPSLFAKDVEGLKKEAASIYSEYLDSQVECLSFGYYKDNGGFFYPGVPQTSTIFSVGVNSPNQSYFLRLNYEYKLHVGRTFFGENTFSYVRGAIDSDTRCVATVLKNMYDEGYEAGGEEGAQEIIEMSFAGNETAIALANEIITNNTQAVKIKYLVDIEGTPFARAVYETVQIPVISGGVYMDDVIAYKKTLDEDFIAFKALDSTAYNITLDETEANVYRVNYLKNVVVQTVTVDGEYCESYLDINKSYQDFYQPLIQSGLLQAETFEYVYSTSILNAYPQLSGYTFDEVHGYFGFVSAPQTITFDSVMSNAFVDFEKSKIGIVEGHYFEKDINAEDYIALMRDYGYTLTDTFWSYFFTGFWDMPDVVTGNEVFPANFYVFYSMPGTNKAVIAEGGQTEIGQGSALDVEVMQVTQKIGAGVSAVANDVGDYSYYITWGLLALLLLYGLYKFGPYLGFGGKRTKRTRSSKSSSTKKSKKTKKSKNKK